MGQLTICNAHTGTHHLISVFQIFVLTGMSCLWNIPDVAPSASLEEEVITSVHPLQLKMEKMVFTDENCMLFNIGVI